ncbi:MAG: hypothetical protein WCV71_02845 [Patescibacteria group bacterium]
MGLSQDRIKEFKELLEKKTKKEVSWAEAEEGANNLANFFKLLYDQEVIEKKRQIRLEKEPKGFHLEGKGYTCAICKRPISDEETWYDKWGIKCPICQKAINKRIIPGSVAKNDNSWYSKYDLESRFNIDRYAIKRFIKEGVLKPRIVPSTSGRPHVYLFLIKDNKEVLPPKKLTESQLVKEIKEDGKEWLRLEPWYRFVDPFKHLEGYKIMEYLKFTKDKA